ARKSTPRPSTSGRRKKPMATTLVAVPIGVAMPPTLAPKAVMSNSADANGDRSHPGGPLAARTATMPTATGHIMAAAAVLLIHIEMSVTARPTVASRAVGLRLAQRVVSR